MSMSKAYLAEFTHEAASTRKMLALVPEDQLGWKPHEKSMTLGELAGHIAEIPGWAENTLTRDVLDIGGNFVPFVPASVEELLATFDRNVEHFKKTVEPVADDVYKARWQLRHGEQVVVDLPRTAVMRGFILNHIVHHRGQLSVYLRLLDVPLPQVYGPTADAASF